MRLVEQATKVESQNWSWVLHMAFSFSDPSDPIGNNESNVRALSRVLSNGTSLKDTLTSPRRFSPLHRIEQLLPAFAPGERLVLYALSASLALSTFAIVALVSSAASVTVPASGGALVEGMIGPARFLNPLLATSQADEDITQLVYSGLMRATADGDLVPDLAESYTISPDGTTYTFTLRTGLSFHDGTPLTAEDIVYTVGEAQNPAIKSLRRADWEGVQVSAPDSRTVVFTLSRSYAPFIENTTMGILPARLWRNTDPEEFLFHRLNTDPIGSGPYKVATLSTDESGAPVRYSLVPFNDFALGAPYLQEITLRFYPTQVAEIEALASGEIDAIAGISPAQVALLNRSDVQTLASPLQRVFGVFFNQNHSAVLTDSAARTALDAAIDKERLVSIVLAGYGIPLDGPMLSKTAGFASTSQTVSTAYTQESIAAAKAILADGGWIFDNESGAWQKSKQPLSFTLSTADAPELVKTADAIATAWRQAGIQVAVQVYPIADLNTTIIRPRAYDALLFGEVVGRSLDLFAFWHSSQRNDPGLNLALYANAGADTVLAQARATTDRQDRDRLFSQFAEILKGDMPAVFLYAPEFLYVAPTSVRGVQLGTMTVPSDRYLSIHEWYTDTEEVWALFTDATTQ